MKTLEVQPGEMTERVVIQSETRTADGQGGFTITWSDVATVWAKVESVSGREASAAGQVEWTQRYRIWIRKRSIDPAHRVKWSTNGDVVLNIREIHDQGGRWQYLMIVAERGVAM